MATRRGEGGGGGKILLGFVLTIVVLVVGAGVYLRWGPVPVATADKPFPFEEAIVSVPLDARIARQMQTAPFGIDEDVYEGGAKVYRLTARRAMGLRDTMWRMRSICIRRRRRCGRSTRRGMWWA